MVAVSGVEGDGEIPKPKTQDPKLKTVNPGLEAGCRRLDAEDIGEGGRFGFQFRVSSFGYKTQNHRNETQNFRIPGLSMSQSAIIMSSDRATARKGRRCFPQNSSVCPMSRAL